MEGQRVKAKCYWVFGGWNHCLVSSPWVLQEIHRKLLQVSSPAKKSPCCAPLTSIQLVIPMPNWVPPSIFESFTVPVIQKRGWVKTYEDSKGEHFMIQEIYTNYLDVNTWSHNHIPQILVDFGWQHPDFCEVLPIKPTVLHAFKLVTSM